MPFMTKEERQAILHNTDWFSAQSWSNVSADGRLHL